MLLTVILKDTYWNLVKTLHPVHTSQYLPYIYRINALGLRVNGKVFSFGIWRLHSVLIIVVVVVVVVVVAAAVAVENSSVLGYGCVALSEYFLTFRMVLLPEFWIYSIPDTSSDPRSLESSREQLITRNATRQSLWSIIRDIPKFLSSLQSDILQMKSMKVCQLKVCLYIYIYTHTWE